MSPIFIERERQLLAEMRRALDRHDAGRADPDEVEDVRRKLRKFYRALGMHP